MWPSDPGCGVVTAVVQVQSLAWELMHVTDTAKKRKKSTPPQKKKHIHRYKKQTNPWLPVGGERGEEKYRSRGLRDTNC